MTKISVRDRATSKRTKRREELIHTVKTGVEAAGKALLELRDDEHWKDTHSSFSDFCREHFQISKTYLYDVIKGVEVIASLPKQLRGKIVNEAQTRALSKIPENDRADAILGAERNGGISAESLLEHHQKNGKSSVTDTVTSPQIADSTLSEKSGSKPPSKPKTEKPKEKPKFKVTFDKVGTPIPGEAIPFWARRKEVQQFLTQLSVMRTYIKNARDSEDNLWSKHGQNAVEYINRAYSFITDVMPDCVCLACAGNYSLQPQGCNTCGNTGMVSRHRFDTYLPREIRELRIRQNEEIAQTHPDSPLNTKVADEA